MGNFVDAATTSPFEVLPLTIANALCLKWYLSLASNLGFWKVMFKTYHLQLFNLRCKCASGRSSCMYLVVRDF